MHSGIKSEIRKEKKFIFLVMCRTHIFMCSIITQLVQLLVFMIAS